MTGVQTCALPSSVKGREGGVCQGDLAYHCRGRYAAISIAHCATLGAGKEPQGMILFVPLGKTTRSVAPDSYRAGHQLRTSAVFPGTIHSTLGGGFLGREPNYSGHSVPVFRAIHDGR